MKFFFSYTLRSHRPIYQKMFKEKSDSKLHRHLQETTHFKHTTTPLVIKLWNGCSFYYFTTNRIESKIRWDFFSNRMDAVIV